MGMKEEIYGIAKALGYDGDAPSSKTGAVRAVASVAGSSGYSVTTTEQWVMEPHDVDFGDGTGAVVIATAEHMPQEVTVVSGTAVNHYFTIDGEELLDFYTHAEGEEQDKEYIAESGSMDGFPGTWYEIAYENMGTENATASVTYVDGSAREPLTGTHSVGMLTILKDAEVSDDFVMAVSKAMGMAGGSSAGHLIDGSATAAEGGSHNIQ